MPPTQGCSTCRTRRIKCDGRKPICQKCVKSQRACVDASAAKQSSFTIHIENQYAKGEKQRPRGPRSTLVPMQPKFDLKTRAHAYYLQNHFEVFQDMPDMATTWSECFHAWKVAGKSSQSVELAFESLALAVFAKTEDWKPAADEACKTYLRLLKIMQTCILYVNRGDMDADEIDAYLWTAYFMARYEAFVQKHSDVGDAEALRAMKVWFHFDGAAAILKVWYDNRDRYTPSDTIKQTRRLIIKSSPLIRENPVPRWLVNGAEFGEVGIALEFDRLLIQIINNHHRYLNLKQLHNNGQPVFLEADNLLNDWRIIDQDIKDWSTRLPVKWSYTRHDLTQALDYPQDLFYSPTIFSCEKPGYSAVWTEYYAMRVLIAHGRLRALDLIRFEPNSSYHVEALRCQASLTSSANSLASFVPFCLERVNIRSNSTGTSVEISNEPLKPYLGNLVVWPMALVSSLQKLNPAQQNWFRSELGRIGSDSSECLIAYALSDYWTIL